MAGLAAAIGTFSSCNKAGSIPQFTQYLSTNPNCYTALSWRGRAYGIVGQIDKAKEDFAKAASVTNPPRKNIALAHLERLNRNHEQSRAILHSTVKTFPQCAEAWSEIGTQYFYGKETDAAFQCLDKSVDLGKSNEETSEPWYPWSNNHLGDICYGDGRIIQSSDYYKEAIRTCKQLTISYLGLSKCDILQNHIKTAKEEFQTAKHLNPSLVKWANFEEFSKDVVAENQNRQVASGMRTGEANRKCNGGGAGSGNGGRNGNGNDDDNNDKNKKEKGARGGIRAKGLIDAKTSDLITKATQKVKKEALEIKEYNNRKYYKIKSKDGDFWYVKDTAGHAGALWKKYTDTKSTLVFKCSATIDDDGNLTEIDPDKKHESKLMPEIEKRKMKNCK